MAGRGRPPGKTPPRNRTPRQRGEWQATPGVGWQHGPVPEPPAGLRTEEARATWTTWFRSWFAANWSEENLPQLRLTILYFDQVQRAIEDPFIEVDGPREGSVLYIKRPCPMTELRQHMDSLGITPKGQQDRRWERPAEAEPTAAAAATPADDPRKAFGHLVAVK